jgi:hypothetical protein
MWKFWITSGPTILKTLQSCENIRSSVGPLIVRLLSQSTVLTFDGIAIPLPWTAHRHMHRYYSHKKDESPVSDRHIPKTTAIPWVSRRRTNIAQNKGSRRLVESWGNLSPNLSASLGQPWHWDDVNGLRLIWRHVWLASMWVPLGFSRWFCPWRRKIFTTHVSD